MTIEQKVTIKELKELEAKATSAPWKVRRNQSTNKPACQITTTEKIEIVTMCRGDMGLDDAKLITATRNALPELIRVIELAESALVTCGGDGVYMSYKGDLVEQALSEIRKMKGE